MLHPHAGKSHSHARGSHAHAGRSPLYFQHHGHSRTIIGIERFQRAGQSQHEYNLLVLDPSIKSKDIEARLKSGKGWQVWLLDCLTPLIFVVCCLFVRASAPLYLQQSSMMSCWIALMCYLRVVWSTPVPEANWHRDCCSEPVRYVPSSELSEVCPCLKQPS